MSSIPLNVHGSTCISYYTRICAHVHVCIQRYEIYFNIFQWFIVLIVFVGCTFIPWTNDVADVYLPYGYIIYVGCFLDNTVSCLIPIIASFVLQSRSATYKSLVNDLEANGDLQQNELHIMLHSKQLRSMFKQFAVRSFAPETLLCWEFIERYKSITSRRKRFRFGKELMDKFLSPTGDFEINLPAKLNPREMWKKLKESESNPPLDFFDTLQAHCEVDLVDMFCRFKLRKDYQRVKTKLASVL